MVQSRMSRRSVLGLTGGLAVAGVAGVAGAGLLDGGHASAGNVGAKLAKAPAKRFAHPGLLHTSADLKRMRTKVRAGAAPWQAGWKVLEANSHSRSGWKARPQATVYRGGSPQNYVLLYNDIHAAYQNALRWKITGDRVHGDAARDILNAWSATLKAVSGNADRFLAAGIYGYQFANAAELMRGYPGFDLARFQKMMREVFYPMNDDFLKHHNGAFITNYWANWDLTAMCSVLAIGILCDDHAKVRQAVTYFKSGAGNGSIRHAVPYLHPGGLGQWQEAGRDQGHATLGIGLMGTFCEMAWNQGYDLYGYDDNRFLKGCEYVAKYNLGHDVPFTPYTWKSGAANTHGRTLTQTEVSPSARGIVRPIWAMVYNHYVRRRGLHAPFTKAMAAKVRPEGGGGNYGPNSGGFDQLGFGTLAFTR
ncbi:alginate lyase family protein [Actinoallomurus sp. CA-150999]|uniref:alginate lyase family protein n=1 Tax=Actinoallomurus sp. CA-150999 TaxID=3239887 RepID=UPI003D900B57